MKRDPKAKAKHLRREGFVPGCVYGKNYNPSLLIQIPEKDALAFLKHCSVGSTATLSYGNKKINTILKEATMVPLSPNIEHLTFQELVKGEKVIGTVKLTLANKSHVDGVTKHILYEVQYKATSEYLIEEIIIDMEGKKIGDHIKLEDIPELNTPHIDLLSPTDSLVVEVVELRVKEEPESDETEDEPKTPVVIGSEEDA
jgi:large subunit ribosomal protein L25